MRMRGFLTQYAQKNVQSPAILNDYNSALALSRQWELFLSMQRDETRYLSAEGCNSKQSKNAQYGKAINQQENSGCSSQWV